MKKINLLSLIGAAFGIVSLSAHANPPVAEGVWTGTYTVSQNSPSGCTPGSTGTATLTQKNVEQFGTDTRFTSTLTLQGLNTDPNDSSIPPFSTGVTGQSVIAQSQASGVFINQDIPNQCAVFTQTMGYDDDAQKIVGASNDFYQPFCHCWVTLSDLTFKASPTARK